jgi:hypothetical protein
MPCGQCIHCCPSLLPATLLTAAERRGARAIQLRLCALCAAEGKSALSTLDALSDLSIDPHSPPLPAMIFAHTCAHFFLWARATAHCSILMCSVLVDAHRFIVSSSSCFCLLLVVLISCFASRVVASRVTVVRLVSPVYSRVSVL